MKPSSGILASFGALMSSLFVWKAFGLELEYLNQVVLPSKLQFKKTTVGGLSGLLIEGDSLYAVSDDRGNVNEPRIYEFAMTVSLKEFRVVAKDVIFLAVNETPFSHKKPQSKAKIFSQVIDLEALSLTPWGDFLVANEGDANHKPRVPPQLIDVKKDGTIVRDFEVPPAFLPEPSGEQKKGVQNNLAFEGLAANPNGKEWILATEGPLVQDPRSFVRFIQYRMPEAWVLKPQSEWNYPLGDDKETGWAYRGISEVHFLDEKRLFVMERAVQLGSQGLKLLVQIFETEIPGPGKDQMLVKRPVLDLAGLKDKIGPVENFEGMTLGPKLSDGRRSLILVSDDNFMRNQRTQFLLFAIKE